MTDDHHDNRYEDGDDSTGTVEDYVDWSKRVATRTVIARDLRPGDVIDHRGRMVKVKATDEVSRFIEIETECHRMFFVRWDKPYSVATQAPDA